MVKHATLDEARADLGWGTNPGRARHGLRRLGSGTGQDDVPCADGEHEVTVGLVHNRTMMKSVTHTGHTSSGHDSPWGCTKSIHEHPQHWGQLLSQHMAGPTHTPPTYGITGWERRC